MFHGSGLPRGLLTTDSPQSYKIWPNGPHSRNRTFSFFLVCLHPEGLFTVSHVDMWPNARMLLNQGPWWRRPSWCIMGGSSPAHPRGKTITKPCSFSLVGEEWHIQSGLNRCLGESSEIPSSVNLPIWLGMGTYGNIHLFLEDKDGSKQSLKLANFLLGLYAEKKSSFILSRPYEKALPSISAHPGSLEFIHHFHSYPLA